MPISTRMELGDEEVGLAEEGSEDRRARFLVRTRVIYQLNNVNNYRDARALMTSFALASR